MPRVSDKVVAGVVHLGRVVFSGFGTRDRIKNTKRSFDGDALEKSAPLMRPLARKSVCSLQVASRGEGVGFRGLDPGAQSLAQPCLMRRN